MVTTASLGFPRIGPNRELKQALEAFWAGRADATAFVAATAAIRHARWQRQRHLGIGLVPSNDFSWYDHMLDTCVLVGAIPERFHGYDASEPTGYFRLARGGDGIAALEMTKWFDTNYHYLVPELAADSVFPADPRKPVAEYREALAQGVRTRPVLVGPVTFLRLAKATDGSDLLQLVPALVRTYVAALTALADCGVRDVQMDEPILVTDLEPVWQEAVRDAYATFAAQVPQIRLLVATYFGGIAHHLPLLASLPVSGLHCDLVRAPQQLPAVLAAWPADRVLSLGIVDGRNVWASDLDRAIGLVRTVLTARAAEQVQIAPGCSLLHVPVSMEGETLIADDAASWLAFACEKCTELGAIARAATGGDAVVASELARSRRIVTARQQSPVTHLPAVRTRVAAITDNDRRRATAVAERLPQQRRRLNLPLFPTTTIGSFPQTKDIRAARAAHRSGRLDAAGYEQFLREQTAACIRFQDEAGLDVLVHGEYERTDMVEYFGEQLSGFVVTANGWVQSYGSRCVKPPIIIGDIDRPRPMTVAWAQYAQSLTAKPMKGMLTGPVTILQWSFVRDDLPRSVVADQIALALRDEIADLQAAGIAVIQVDEPAFREGLPLRQQDQPGYLAWAVGAFRLATAGVVDTTQIHTHMCYSEFNDIITAIADLDADVISIETARSRMELLDAFERFHWPAEIGPGVYDIHSPAVPDASAMANLLRRACSVLRPEQVWVNPDCGLKTRGWAEVEPSLRRLVEAARLARQAMTKVG